MASLVEMQELMLAEVSKASDRDRGAGAWDGARNGALVGGIAGGAVGARGMDQIVHMVGNTGEPGTAWKQRNRMFRRGPLKSPNLPSRRSRVLANLMGAGALGVPTAVAGAVTGAGMGAMVGRKSKRERNG